MELTLDSGSKLVITVAPFADAHGLLKALLRAIKGTNLAGLDIPDSIEQLRGNWSILSKFIDRIVSMVTSDEVEEWLFKCFQRVAYNDQKITKALMDDPQMGEQLRRDYYTICYKVIEANCKPFFEQTFSGLKMSPPPLIKDPELL